MQYFLDGLLTGCVCCCQAGFFKSQYKQMIEEAGTTGEGGDGGGEAGDGGGEAGLGDGQTGGEAP